MRRIYSDIKLFFIKYAIMFDVLLIIALFVPANTIEIASFYLFIVVLFDASQLIVEKILARRYADHTFDVHIGIIKIESDVLLNQLLLWLFSQQMIY